MVSLKCILFWNFENSSSSIIDYLMLLFYHFIQSKHCNDIVIYIFRRRGKKGRNDNCPTVPNQPSEASAHFFFELAKTILTKAGGNSSTSLFTQASANANHTGPHRGLHLCAFEIGLYALRLHNAVTPNWLSRTYSSHVSWITGKLHY